MIDPFNEFRRELDAAAEREWAELASHEREAILDDYDLRAANGDLDWAIFTKQWRRERGR